VKFLDQLMLDIERYLAFIAIVRDEA